MKEKDNQNKIERAPVIVIMGHIDHGKSALLDYIRKSNVVDKEVGNITQHISAYEVIHEKDGKKRKITFLDTPGHEAFQCLRLRGAKVADIGILIVSAEEGVKKQTLEAYKCIKEENIPFIVAINKIDKEGSNIEKTKANLIENEIYLEGNGGDIPYVNISAKTGEGINDLLDIMLLVSEMEELTGDTNKKAEGVVIESSLDPKKGSSATLIIKDGTLKKGMFVVCENDWSPVRIMEDFLGKNLEKASFSTPVRIVGWSSPPKAGNLFLSFNTKKEAEEHIKENSKKSQKKDIRNETDGEDYIPIIIKADTLGSLEAIEGEIKKMKNEKIKHVIVHSAVGNITEKDILMSDKEGKTIVAGFNVKIDSSAENIALKLGTEIKTFEIIYKLTEWIEKEIEKKSPIIEEESKTGLAKILKNFSRTKDKQVIGGKVQEGKISINEDFKIIRGENEIGKGKIKELQSQKVKKSEVDTGNEFGMLVESKIEIMPGDKIETFIISTK